MDQQYPSILPLPQTPPAPSAPPVPPAPPASSKEWRTREIVSLIFLVLLPIVGLILMWTITNWSKKAKIIITLALSLPLLAICGILSSIVLVSMSGARGAASDALMKADMHQIVIAQEMYYSDNYQYYQSVNYPAKIPGAFEFVMPVSKSADSPYGWVDNTEDGQKFCAYADLKKGGFYVASDKGNGEITVRPFTLSDCEAIGYGF